MALVLLLRDLGLVRGDGGADLGLLLPDAGLDLVERLLDGGRLVRAEGKARGLEVAGVGADVGRVELVDAGALGDGQQGDALDALDAGLYVRAVLLGDVGLLGRGGVGDVGGLLAEELLVLGGLVLGLRGDL